MNQLPDIAREPSLDLYAPLNWVGMSDISVPVGMEIKGQLITVPARVDAQVSLDLSSARGIHMSRLYSLVQENLVGQALTAESLAVLTEEFLASHSDLSSSSRVRVRMDLPVERKALKSGHRSWRTYPVAWWVENRRGRALLWMEVEIAYSSTCPASAALSRQLIQENFKAHFAGEELSFQDIHHWLGTTEGMLATPHAQRSFACVAVEMALGGSLDSLALIDGIEDALQTPVQTMVKREDEQEFARRNGQNLMFCEDAARRIQMHLTRQASVQDYWIHVNHKESLHPHNAVCYLSKSPESSLKATW